MALDEEASACQSRLVKSCGPSGLQDLAFSEIDSSFASSATGGASDRRQRFAGHPTRSSYELGSRPLPSRERGIAASAADRPCASGSARDDRRPPARLAPQTSGRRNPFAALFEARLAGVSRAGSAREAGEKPAVVSAKADNKMYRFAGCFLRERRNSNPRPPA